MKFEISWALMELLMKLSTFMSSHENAHETFNFHGRSWKCSWNFMELTSFMSAHGNAHEISNFMSAHEIAHETYKFHERSWKCSWELQISWAGSWADFVVSWESLAHEQHGLLCSLMSVSWASHEQISPMSKRYTLESNWGTREPTKATTTTPSMFLKL